jgi:prepilin-type N-terminal cleavage/methylation domain-containing protein
MNTDMSSIKVGILKETKGFTLVELLVGIVISAIVITATMKIYTHMQNSNLQQVEISLLQQNQRGALAIMERELRLIGMDRDRKKGFDVKDVRRFSITEPGTDAIPDASATGSPILRVAMDLNDNGTIDVGETITYALYDRNNDKHAPWELCRSTTLVNKNAISGRQMLAEGIEAIGFAYAFDWDNGTPDGKIDRVVVNPGDPPSIIWAIDSNNDGVLDADPGGNPLGYTVPPANIRAVQLWILGSAQRPDPTYLNSNLYSVCNNPPFTPNDHFHRWLLTEIIHCRNM